MAIANSSPTSACSPICATGSRPRSARSAIPAVFGDGARRLHVVAARSRFWISAQSRPILNARRVAIPRVAYQPIVCGFAERALLLRGAGRRGAKAMAGHSQFKNIMHRKGRQDAARSKLFGKLAREITVSAKIGLPDPAMNPRLRAAVIAARAENMPKDNIDRAIKKATGGEAESYDEIRYEGYGPGGVAVIVEVLTDNRNRTAGEVRATFTKSGGNLAETGAVSFMFDHVGVVEYDA